MEHWTPTKTEDEQQLPEDLDTAESNDPGLEHYVQVIERPLDRAWDWELQNRSHHPLTSYVHDISHLSEAQWELGEAVNVRLSGQTQGQPVKKARLWPGRQVAGRCPEYRPCLE